MQKAFTESPPPYMIDTSLFPFAKGKPAVSRMAIDKTGKDGPDMKRLGFQIPLDVCTTGRE